MTTKKSNDRSLILYTSLIFIVAIIMIIVSFFAQTHLDQSKISEIDEEKVSLSNKAAQVSEENMQLVELNKSFRDANAEFAAKNEELTAENERLTLETQGYKALMEVSEKILGGNKDAAKALLKNIYTEDLSKEQKLFYDALVKKTE